VNLCRWLPNITDHCQRAESVDRRGTESRRIRQNKEEFAAHFFPGATTVVGVLIIGLAWSGDSLSGQDGHIHNRGSFCDQP
jgi:hypothetical protein